MTDLELLEQRLKGSALQYFVFAFTMATLAGIAAVAIVMFFLAGKPGGVGFIGLMMLMAIFGAWVMFQTGRELNRGKESTLYKAINGQSEFISWTHGAVGRTSAFKVYFRTGEMFTVRAHARDAEKLVQLVKKKIPGVIVGYGIEQQKAWVAQVKAFHAQKKQVPVKDE